MQPCVGIGEFTWTLVVSVWLAIKSPLINFQVSKLMVSMAFHWTNHTAPHRKLAWYQSRYVVYQDENIIGWHFEGYYFTVIFRTKLEYFRIKSNQFSWLFACLNRKREIEKAFSLISLFNSWISTQYCNRFYNVANGKVIVWALDKPWIYQMNAIKMKIMLTIDNGSVTIRAMCCALVMSSTSHPLNAPNGQW